jgi:hypothetical protein
MSRALPRLSDNLGALLHQFSPFEQMGEGEVAEIGADSIKVITRNLRLMRTIATHMETELNVYRLMDAGRVYTATVEQLAQDAAVGLVLETTGNVITPNFGRKR